MRTSNPALNDRTFAPERIHVLDTGRLGADGSGRPAVMTLDGVVGKSALLLVLLVAAAVVGWGATERSDAGVDLPIWVIGAALAALAVAVVTIFKPLLARYTAPVYAVLEGLFVGAISAVYESRFEGIVLQAVALTIGVFALLLFLYATRVIKVTENFRLAVTAATGAVMVVYLATFVVRLLGADIPFIHDSGPVGIIFSLVVVGIASMNLVLDFDFIETGVERGAPKRLEWYAGFGLLVTVVWLYLELLRLLAKLRSR